MNKTVYAVILCSALATGSSYSMDGDENSGGGIEATVAALRAEIQELRGANEYLNASVTGLNRLLANVIASAGPAIELTVEKVEDLTEWTAGQDQVVLRVNDQTQELSRKLDEQKILLQQGIAQERRDRLVQKQRDLRAQKNSEDGLRERLDEQAYINQNMQDMHTQAQDMHTQAQRDITRLNSVLHTSIRDLLIVAGNPDNPDIKNGAVTRLGDLANSIK